MAQPGLEVRRARDDERHALRDVVLAAYDEHAAAMPPPAWERYQANLVATLEADGPAEAIVALADGRVVGAALLFPPGAGAYGGMAGGFECPEVRLLSVLPAARGRGVGRALMDACVEHARASGAAALGLHTVGFMRAALRLYERMGFERAPEYDFSPAPGFVVAGYRLALAPDPKR